MSFGKGRAKPLTPRVVPAVVDGGEKRTSNRRVTQSPGLVFPGGMAASVPCTIVDQSMSGAKLVMQEGWGNPFFGTSGTGQQFRLVMRQDRLEADCEIMWIEGHEIGVRFVSVMRPTARKN